MYIKLVGVYISDIHLQVLYTPTSFLQEVYMKFIHLLLSNLIGQNVQAMVQVIYQPRMEQSDWSEVTSHGIQYIIHDLCYLGTCSKNICQSVIS